MAKKVQKTKMKTMPALREARVLIERQIERVIMEMVMPKVPIIRSVLLNHLLVAVIC